MIVKCALCDGYFNDFDDGDDFCAECAEKLENFFGEAEQIDGDTEDMIDYQLLAQELRAGLAVISEDKISSKGLFPTFIL